MAVERGVTVMKSLILRLALFSVSSTVLWANPISFQNSGGKLTSNGSTLSVNGSTVTTWAGTSGNALSGGLGVLSLKTGSIVSGSLAMGAMFASGGSLSIFGNGTNGIPKATLFSGTFTGPVSWKASFHPTAGPNHQGAWYYSLNGKINGSLSNGQRISGAFHLSTLDVPKGAQFSSAANLEGGLGNLAVPEPGSLGLLASGLVGLAVVLRKRLV